MRNKIIIVLALMFVSMQISVQATNKFETADGTSYSFDGTVFYVSDPTFIGSHTGMVMPTYRGLEPKVDYTYGDRR